MSGELLRAILEKSSLDSNPAFYRLEHAFGASVTRQEVSLQLGRENYFLIMQLMPYKLDVFGVAVFGPLLANSFQLVRSRNSQKFFSDATIGNLLGNNANYGYTMPEYWLLEPAETLTMIIDPVNVVANQRVGMHFAGIEYRV